MKMAESQYELQYSGKANNFVMLHFSILIQEDSLNVYPPQAAQ